MKPALSVAAAQEQVPRIAIFGLIAKGFVYVLLGVLVLLQALDITSSGVKDKTGVLQSLQESFAGRWLLPLLALGLVCYTVWRFIEAYHFSKRQKWGKTLRYFFSGVIYLFVSYTALSIFFNRNKENGDSEQQFAAEMLNKPFGEWLVGLAALSIAAVGIYQLYYGFSGKYRDHVQKMNLDSAKARVMLASGLIGYPARGIVWLIIAYLMFKAAVSGSSSNAGDTGKAIRFAQVEWGWPFLAAIAIGLIAYGAFNFVRARYERFD